MNKCFQAFVFFAFYFLQSFFPSFAFASSYEEFLEFKVVFHQDLVLPCPADGYANFLIHDGAVNTMTQGEEERKDIDALQSSYLITSPFSVSLLIRIKCGYKKASSFLSDEVIKTPSPTFKIKKGDTFSFSKMSAFEVKKISSRTKKLEKHPLFVWKKREVEEIQAERLSDFSYSFKNKVTMFEPEASNGFVKELHVLGSSKQDDLTSLGLNPEGITFKSSLMKQITGAFRGKASAFIAFRRSESDEED